MLIINHLAVDCKLGHLLPRKPVNCRNLSLEGKWVELPSTHTSGLSTHPPLESSTTMESGYFKSPVWEGRVLSGAVDNLEAISSLRTPGASNHSLGDAHSPHSKTTKDPLESLRAINHK